VVKRSIDKVHRATARRLRINATDAEARLWRRLRRFPIAGTHFRRQVPIGPYVADFACMAARLIIEIDGSQHADQQRSVRDEARTQWFSNEGYRVIRFWNNDVSQHIEGVLEAIYAAIHGSLSAEPSPLRHMRRGKAHSSASGDFTPPRPPSPPLRSGSAVDPPPPGEGGTGGTAVQNGQR
jgi:very-short-patch-repair endonuclease